MKQGSWTQVLARPPSAHNLILRTIKKQQQKQQKLNSLRLPFSSPLTFQLENMTAYPPGTDPHPEREAEMIPNEDVVPDAGKVSGLNVTCFSVKI